VAVDLGTVLAGRAQKSPPSQGGWQVSPGASYGVDFVDPSNWRLRANGENATVGSPNIPELEAEIAAWYEAGSLDEEKAIARRVNKAALDNVVYAPLGWRLNYQAWRKNVSGIMPGPAVFFWHVSKTV
jgi:peptide/nickel transport system substrate-binding protein